MTTKRISELNELLIPDFGNDYYVVVDSDENETKKILMSLGGGVGVTTHAMTTGQSILTVGTELKDTGIEVIFLSAIAAETLQMINGARDGNIKVLIAINDNVTISRNDSYIKTKNPIANPDFSMKTGDVIALANRSGSPATSTNGTWLEIWRALQV